MKQLQAIEYESLPSPKWLNAYSPTPPPPTFPHQFEGTFARFIYFSL